jgi:hypothetical protein
MGKLTRADGRLVGIPEWKTQLTGRIILRYILDKNMLWINSTGSEPTIGCCEILGSIESGEFIYQLSNKK